MLSNAISLLSCLMVPGRFILPRVGHNGKPGYCVFDGNMNPVRAIKPSEYKQINIHLKEKKGVMTIDLRSIRSLHGNSSFKKKYKQIRKLNSNN